MNELDFEKLDALKQDVKTLVADLDSKTSVLRGYQDLPAVCVLCCTLSYLAVYIINMIYCTLGYDSRKNSHCGEETRTCRLTGETAGVAAEHGIFVDHITLFLYVSQFM
jgi:hypothetical protein